MKRIAEYAAVGLVFFGLLNLGVVVCDGWWRVHLPLAAASWAGAGILAWRFEEK